MPAEPLVPPSRTRKTKKFLKLSMEGADGKSTHTEIELSELWGTIRYAKKFGYKKITIEDAIQKPV